MVRVFVLNCELASLKGFAPWEKHVFLQCVTEDHRSVHVVINKHFHHTLSLRVAESDQHRVANMDRDELQGQMSSFLEQMGCNPRYPPVTDVELTFRTPLVGFTNMRRDPIIELTLSNPSKQYKVLGALEENDMVFGDIEIAAAVDPKNIGSQFMQQHDVRIYSWCELDVPVQSIGLRPNGRLPARAWYGDYVLPLQLNRNRGGATYLVAPTRLRTCAEQPPPLVPTTLFLRTHAVSSTAVFGNVYAPSAELAGDVVKTIVCTVATADGKTEEIVLSNDDDDDEKGLLDRFVRLLCERSVQVVVQSSEIRDDLLYLARRAQRHKLQILSSVHGCDSYISEFNGKVIDLVHLGRVRVDVAQVLQKLMVSPPLGGYTLLSALAHPKIVRDKSRHAFLDDLAYMPSNVFSSAEEIEHDLRCNVRLLRDVYEDASMLLNNGNVARTCDLPIRKVVERGQQARVMGCIRRKMFDNKVYMNNELCDTPYLVVDMPQDQSSFADPPWLENPPLSIFWSKWRTAAEKEQEYVERKELIQQLAGQMEGDVDRAKQVVRNKVKAEARKEARIIEKALEAYVRRHEHEEGKKKGEVPVLPPFCQPVVAPVAAEEEKKKKRTFEDMMREKKVLFVPRKKKKTKKAFSGGLVLEPEPKFYCKPEETVVTLDFGALYPSIIEAERFGYMTLVWDRRWLEDPRARKKFVPINETQCCVYVTHYDDVPVSCIVTEIVHEVNGNRKKIKRKMKTEKDPFQYAALNAAQLTAKVVANSVYGFLGSKTSGLTVTALAASVCAVGRWMNKTARHFVMVRGNRVVYGDTDSIFVIYKVPVSLLRLPRGPERWEKIKQWIYMRAERDEIDLTALYRAPNKMEFETTKDPIMLTKNKKTYTAWEFGEKFGAWRNPKPKVLIKGFAFNKRDKCAFAREIGHFAVRRLLAQQLDGIVPDLREKLLQFEPRPTSMEQLQPYVITIEFATSYKSETVIGPHLAQQYQEETGVRPIPGQRMPYVVARHEDERLHYESTVTLRGLLKRRMHLDPSYYLLTQVLKSLAQLFGQEKELLDRITRMIEQVAAHFETIVADVPTFQKMRRWSRASRSTPCFSQE